jgi:hypothetical protein
MTTRILSRVAFLRSSGWLAISLCAAPAVLPAQTAQFVREKVLPQAGRAEKLGQEFPFSPLGKGTGRIFRQTYTLKDATEYRLHVKIKGDVPAGGVSEVRITPRGGGEAWSWTPTGDQREIWSAVVPNNSVLELWSTVPGNRIQAVIDSTISVTPAPKQLAITPPDDRKSIIGQPEDFVTWGKSVGRIRFVSDDGGEYLCTGFLIAADLIMTNNHCMKTQTEAATAQIDFDYDRQGVRPVTISVKELVFADADLDFAVHRLKKNANRPALKLVDSEFRDGQALLIIQHPAGEPKQISQQDCKVSGPSIAGVSAALTDFGHLCDTLGGSSGSPVIDLTSKVVVGIHHLGFIPTSATLVNQGVKMGLILKLVRERRPDILTP